MSLAELAKKVKSNIEKDATTTEEKLLKTLDKFFVSPNSDKGRKDRVSRLAFRPSSIHKCEREIYFMLTEEPTTEKDKPRSVRILEVGTALHEWVQQEVFMRMGDNPKFGLELLGKEDMYSFGAEGIEFVREEESPPMEIKFIDSRWTNKFPISAMVDGAMRYDNTDMLFEFKTINTKDFSLLIEPKLEHKMQGAMYSLCTGIPRVLFLYLDKNTQELKAFIQEYSQAQIDYIVDKMLGIEEQVIKGEVPDIPNKADCMFCKYKKACAKIEEQLNTNIPQ